MTRTALERAEQAVARTAANAGLDLPPWLALVYAQAALGAVNSDERLPVEAHGIRLSAAQIGVLRLVALGLSNADIGRRLYVCEDTVKAHLRAITITLKATNRINAVAIAFARGLLTAADLEQEERVGAI